jgi:hypothetical protein
MCIFRICRRGMRFFLCRLKRRLSCVYRCLGFGAASGIEHRGPGRIEYGHLLAFSYHVSHVKLDSPQEARDRGRDDETVAHPRPCFFLNRYPERPAGYNGRINGYRLRDEAVSERERYDGSYGDDEDSSACLSGHDLFSGS